MKRPKGCVQLQRWRVSVRCNMDVGTWGRAERQLPDGQIISQGFCTCPPYGDAADEQKRLDRLNAEVGL